jgi:hypothetical protein
MIFFFNTVSRYLFLVSIYGVICLQIFVFPQDSLKGAICFIFSIMKKIRYSTVCRTRVKKKN